MKECTFAPQVHSTKERRKFDEFIKDQKKYLEKKQENIAKLAKDNEEKEISELIGQPEINTYSKILVEQKEEKEDIPVHERLYKKSKKPIPEEEEKKEVKTEEKTAGSGKKKENRAIALYEEAKKRQENWIKKQQEQLVNPKKPKEFSKDQYVQQKYVKEFMSAIGENPAPLLKFDEMSIFPIFL